MDPTIRKLLLPLSDTTASRAALETGLHTAAIWGAHLAALAVRPDSRDAAPLAGDGLSGAMIEDMMAAADRDSSERVSGIAAAFTAAAARHDLPSLASDEPNRATAALHFVTGREREIVPAHARLADLTILPRSDPDDDAASSDSLHAVLFDSGRPLLLAPRDPPTAIGTRCCIAWNGTAESAAALAVMLPWLRRASAVRILHADDYQRPGPRAEQVLPYLRLHGIEADIALFRPIARDVGAGLLDAASAFGADLLGMGAYSHSRLRQLILGGVTRFVLQNAQVPVLMSR